VAIVDIMGCSDDLTHPLRIAGLVPAIDVFARGRTCSRVSNMTGGATDSRERDARHKA